MSMRDDQAPHRLFAAIVLMGTGLAAGCGGISTGERHVGSGGGQPTGGTGTGTAGSAVSTPPGGATSIGSGGAIQIDPGIPNPGGPDMTPVKPGPFACPPQLWTCSQMECGRVTSGWTLQEGCECDKTRPLNAADCPADKVFACLSATSTADGRPLTEEVPMSCTCIERAEYFCSDECDRAFGLHDLRCDGGEDQRSVTCGCAVVYLK